MKGWYQWNPRTPIGCSLKKNDVLLFQWKGSDWSGGWKWCWNQCPQNPQVSICLRAKRRGLGSRRRSNSSRSISTVSWKACLQRISISHHFKTPCTCSNNDMLVIFGDVWWCRIVLHCEVSDRLYRDYLRRKERAEAQCVQQSSQERRSWVLDYVELVGWLPPSTGAAILHPLNLSRISPFILDIWFNLISNHCTSSMSMHYWSAGTVILLPVAIVSLIYIYIVLRYCI